MKKIIFIVLSSLPLLTLAQTTAETELRSAQLHYRTILMEGNNQETQLTQLQQQLQTAETQLNTAQQEVEQLRQAIQTLQQAQQQHQQQLQNAGERLDKAWQTLHGH